MAISANHQPHFTTIADFISSSSEAISQLFLQVLLICDSQGLIGKEMFAVDGCKISSNASKEWSGKFEDLAHKQQKMEAGISHILKKHKETDQKDLPQEIREREERQVKTLQKASAKIKEFLAQNKERESKPGHIVQSNITDKESAKIKSSHGVIQGYTAVAAVDAKHQIIVAAEVYGQGQEHGLQDDSLQLNISRKHREGSLCPEEPVCFLLLYQDLEPLDVYLYELADSTSRILQTNVNIGKIKYVGGDDYLFELIKEIIA